MSSIAINRTVTGNKAQRTEKKTFLQKISNYMKETSELFAPGVFAMNNTYYRPVK